MNNTAPSKADQIYVVLLTGRAVWEICFNQSEALPRSGRKHFISMEFLRLFLRRHFAGKPVVVSENVRYRVALYQFCLECFLFFNTASGLLLLL